MGLDNGIRLKSKTRIDFPDYIQIDGQDFSDEHDGFPFTYDICYWRKCRNVRSAIFDIIDRDKDDDNQYVFDVTADDCRKIAEVFIEYLKNPESWDDENLSIWTFDEYKNHIADDIINLSWLSKVLCENNKCYAEFYDSY